MEHLIYLELKAYQDYFAQDAELRFWRVDKESEVDFIINQEVAIEVKSTEFVTDKHLKGLNKFTSLGKCRRQIVVSLDPHRRQIEDIEIIPYREFLKELWEGGVFET